MNEIIRRIVIGGFILSVLFYTGVTVHEKIAGDHTPPVIKMDQDRILVHAGDESEILSGIHAEDDQDGDVTDSLLIENISIFLSNGEREVTIAAFDHYGNVAKAKRTIQYLDYKPSRITIHEPLNTQISDTASLLKKITVEDCLDGDLTQQLKIVPESSSRITQGGSYPVRLQVSNSAGDTVDIPATIDFYDQSYQRPNGQFALKSYLIYLQKGEAFDPAAYLDTLQIYDDIFTWKESERKFVYSSNAKGDDIDGDAYTWENTIGLDKLDITNPVNTGQPGNYEVTYEFAYEENNAIKARLIVVVE